MTRERKCQNLSSFPIKVSNKSIVFVPFYVSIKRSISCTFKAGGGEKRPNLKFRALRLPDEI
ncbi:uncharacterized protein Dvar_56480 [Desulfosarcina variabilis str. Montpellier]